MSDREPPVARFPVEASVEVEPGEAPASDSDTCSIRSGSPFLLGPLASESGQRGPCVLTRRGEIAVGPSWKPDEWM